MGRTCALEVCQPHEIEELRILAFKGGPVRRQAIKLIVRRMPSQSPKIDPRKVLNSSVKLATDLHAFLPELAQFIIELDDRGRLLTYRGAFGKLLFAAGKLREVLDSLPQLRGADDDPPVTFDEIRWQESIRAANERHRQYLESLDRDDEDSPPVGDPATHSDLKPTLRLQKSTPAKKLPPLKLRKRLPAA